jgi:hypothetical protein
MTNTTHPTLRVLLDARHAASSAQLTAFLDDDAPTWNLLQRELARLDAAISATCLEVSR